MGNAKHFYEGYWQERERINYLHINQDAWIPPRIQIAMCMISSKRGALNCIDVGCGEGTLGKLLKARFGQGVYVIGCDISDVALKHAAPYYDEVLQINVETDEFAGKLHSRRFDYIICLEVLEHLFKPGKLLEQFQKLLKENGKIIVSFPNIAWYKYRFELLKGNFPQYYLLYPGEHIQFFTLHSFRELLEKSGFVVSEMEGQFIYPGLLRATKMLVPILRRFPTLFGYQLVIEAKPKRIRS